MSSPLVVTSYSRTQREQQSNMRLSESSTVPGIQAPHPRRLTPTVPATPRSSPLDWEGDYLPHENGCGSDTFVSLLEAKVEQLEAKVEQLERTLPRLEAKLDRIQKTLDEQTALGPQQHLGYMQPHQYYPYFQQPPPHDHNQLWPQSPQWPLPPLLEFVPQFERDTSAE